MPEDTKPATTELTILCEECGDIVKVKDPAALLRMLHLTNACVPMQQVLGEPK